MSSFSLTETWKTIAPTVVRPAIRRTKIVCTLGPASTDPETIYELAAAGMDVARLNFSHGSHDEHLERLAAVRIAQDRLGRPIAVLADLCGPKIRVTGLREPMQVAAGDALVLTAPERAQAGELGVSFAALLAEVVAPGDEVLIDDGRIRARAEGSDGTRLLCRVEVGGTIKPSKGVNLPSSSLPIPALTDKDRVDLQFALAAGADYVALSFVRTAGRRRGAAQPDRRRRLHGADRREDREGRGGREPRRDHRGGGRGHGGARRPRRRDRRLAGAARPEAHHRARPRSRSRGDHRDADARVDDPRARADAGRGVRRRERDPRRHVRGHALGRDRRGRLPAARGGADGRDRALGGAVARLRAAGRARCGRRGDPDPRRVRPRRRRRRRGDRRPDGDRSDGAARLPLPAAGTDRGGGDERRRPAAARARVGGRAAPRRRAALDRGRVGGHHRPSARARARAPGRHDRPHGPRRRSVRRLDEPRLPPPRRRARGAARIGCSVTDAGSGRVPRARRSPVVERAHELLRRFGSPLYVYDLREVERRYARFVQAFPYRPLECHYARRLQQEPGHRPAAARARGGGAREHARRCLRGARRRRAGARTSSTAGRTSPAPTSTTCSGSASPSTSTRSISCGTWCAAAAAGASGSGS